MGTRGGAALSNTSFSRNPGSAGKSCKSGKINKTLQTKIFKGLKENNIRHLLHCHASLSEAEELSRMNRITSITFCFLEQRPTQPVATCAHVQGAACTGLPSEHPSEALNLLTKPLNKAHGPLSQTALQQDQSWLLNMYLAIRSSGLSSCRKKQPWLLLPKSIKPAGHISCGNLQISHGAVESDTNQQQVRARSSVSPTL